MTFLNPLAFVFAALAIPIVLLYMLRLRRREIPVSSHFLWQRVLRDYAANTPWQRLKRNLLLLLQLLILALLVLALARPAVPMASTLAGRIVVLLDASASMQATELSGQTRWDIARQRTRALVDQLGVRDELLLLRVADTVELLSDFTNDRARLTSALDSALPGETGADWETAFTVAAASASVNPDTRIIIISDGSAGELREVVLPATVIQPSLITVGEQSANVALAALAVRADEDGNRQIFAQVNNYGEGPVTLSLALRLDGVLWRSQEATLDARAQRSFTFAMNQPFDTVQATLVLPNGSDYLALDNTAFAVAPLEQTRRLLLVSATNADFINRVLAVLPGVQVVQGDATRPTLPNERYDGYIFDGYLPQTLPDADILIVNPPRSVPLFALGTPLEFPRGVSVEQPEHPLLTFVDLTTLNLRRLRPVSSQSLQTLASIGNQPLLLAGEQGSQQIAMLPFDLSDSDLPLQIAFPILMANVLEWFTPRNQLVATASVQTADSIALTSPLNATSVQLTDPQGSTVSLPPDAVYSDTQQRGLYRVAAYQDDTLLASQWVAVNLFDRESRIAPTTDLVLSGTPISAEREQELSLRDLSPWIALAALLMLMVEWWVYHRQFQPRRGGA